MGSGGQNRLPIDVHLAKGSYRRSRHGPIPKRIKRPNLPCYLARTSLPPAPDYIEGLAAEVYEALRTATRWRGARGFPRRVDATVFSMLWAASMTAGAWNDTAVWVELRDLWLRYADRWDFTDAEHERFTVAATAAFRAATWPEMASADWAKLDAAPDDT